MIVEILGESDKEDEGKEGNSRGGDVDTWRGVVDKESREYHDGR